MNIIECFLESWELWVSCFDGIFPQLVNVLCVHEFSTHFPAILCLLLLFAYVEDEAETENGCNHLLAVYEEHTACFSILCGFFSVVLYRLSISI